MPAPRHRDDEAAPMPRRSYDCRMAVKNRPARRADPPAPKPAAEPPAPPAADLDARVLRRFRVVFNAVKTHFQQVEKRVGLGGSQVWALSVIRDRPGIGVNGLAGAMDIHQTTASNLVKALVLAGLAETVRAPEDRRVVRLRLLPPGEAVLRKAPGPFSGVLPQALAQLDPATLERLDRDLGVLISLLEADRRAERVPLADSF